MSNYIGPITLNQVHIRENDEAKADGSEIINIVCTVAQAYQLVGLCEEMVKNTYGSLTVLKGKKTRWGIMPVNTSENLLVNEHQTHTGLYQLLNDIEIEAIGNRPDIVKVHLPVELVSKQVDEILTIVHSKGVEDRSDIEMSSDYSDSEEETFLYDTFTTFDDTNTWHPKYSEGMAATPTIAASGGKLVFTGASSSDGTWGYLWTCLRETLPEEYTAEFTLEWNSLPAGNRHQMNLFIMDGRPSNKTEYEYKDIIRMVLDVRSSGAVFSVDKRVRGSYSNVSEDVSLSGAQKTPAIKIQLEGSSGVSRLTVWIDKNYSGSGTPSYGSPIFGPADTGVNFDLGRYLLMSLENASNVSATARSDFIDIYQEVDALKPNIVVAPPDADLHDTPDFYRASADGNIPCFANPTSFPTYQIDPTDFYNGSVKGMNSNYQDSVARLVTYNEVDLDPTKFTLSNGLIKLVPGTQSVGFQYWNGSSWVTLNTFTLSNPIRLIRPFLVEKDRFILQIDRMLWEMKAGSYGIWVKHPYDDLGYTLKKAYYHDGVLSNALAADADVSMLTQFYSLIFTPHNLVLNANAWGIETDATEWNSVSSVVSRIAPGYGGTGYALSCVTNNVTTYEGIVQANRSVLPSKGLSGLVLNFGAELKGSGTFYMYMTERDSSNGVISNNWGSAINLTGTFTWYDEDLTISSDDTAKVDLQILTKTQQSATLYGDIFQIAPLPIIGKNVWSYTPTSTNKYGMYIVKKDPTTIKSDSIPADSLTGIGVCDQMQPPTANNGYLSLAREWFRPTWQKLLLEGMI